jgi:hypothetical protein
VNARRFSDTIRNSYGWFPQSTENGLGIDATDAMLFEQLLNRRLTEPACLGRGRRQGPKLEKPCRGEVIGQLRDLRVVSPQLMMNAIA